MVQGQVQAADELCKQTRYCGMTYALLRISQEEGLTALYKGIAPALLQQASYGTLKISLYQETEPLE